MALPTYISCFSGAAGLDLAVRLAMPHARCVCHVEIEAAAAAILASRMEEGSLDAAPIWSDARTFDGRPWRGRVGGIIAGFPCPDYSVAGRRAGIVGKHGQLWHSLARIIREVEPQWVFLENVPGILHPHKIKRWRCVGRDLFGRTQWSQYRIPAGIDFVLGDLAEMGFDAEWGCVSAAAVGASHKRERWWCLGVANSQGAGYSACNTFTIRTRKERANFSGNGDIVANSARRGLGKLREPSRRDGLADGIGAAVDYATGARCRWRESVESAPTRHEARLRESCGRCDPVGDAERSGCEESITSSGWAHATQDTAVVDDRPRRPVSAVGDSIGAGLEEWRCERGDDGAECAATERASVPFFAPSPSSPDWADLLVRYPWMRPALAQAETECTVRDGFDGLAALVADTRTDALRAAGNGAVALAGAAALRELLRRSE